MDFPSRKFPPLVITTVSVMDEHRDYTLGNVGNPGAFSFGAGTAIYLPVRIPFAYPMKRFFVVNGTTIAGDLDLALYSFGGSKVIGTGAFTQAGSDAIQYVTANRLISPGLYYFAISNSSSSIGLRAWVPGSVYPYLNGVLTHSSGHPLPSTMVSAAATAMSYLPLFGIAI